MVFMIAIAFVVSLLFQRSTPQHHGYEALQEDKLLVGAWLGGWPGDDAPLIDEFEQEMDVRLDLVDVFIDYYTDVDNVSHAVEHIASRGALPILSWEPHGFTTPEIADGTRSYWLRDRQAVTLASYIDDFAKGLCDLAARTEQPILLRTLHEMNGNWYTWGTSWEDDDGTFPNSDENYKRAWMRIHQAVRSHCQTGVLFVWAINHYNIGDDVTFTGTFPGDAYVDFIGVDGYNWGTNVGWGWKTFDSIFREPYCAVTSVSSRPLLISELSSSEKGGDKAAWIRDTLAGFQSGEYDRVRGFVWFHDDKYEIEIDGPMDWPIDSSEPAKIAFRESATALLAMRNGDAVPSPPTSNSACQTKA